MPEFSFDVEDVIELGEGYKGVTLIGPPVDTSISLGVGDSLLVPTKDGRQAPCECVGFPLVNLGPERVAWIRVSVAGIRKTDIQTGGRATRCS